MVVCVAMQLGRTHDFVLDELSFQQVFLYWENLPVLQGIRKPSRHTSARRAGPDGDHEWVWDRRAREYVPFKEDERNRYFWNRKLMQFER